MEFLTVEEVAEMLGVTKKTVRDYINAQELIAYKLGTSWKIKPEDLETFIQSRSNMKTKGEK